MLTLVDHYRLMQPTADMLVARAIVEQMIERGEEDGRAEENETADSIDVMPLVQQGNHLRPGSKDVVCSGTARGLLLPVRSESRPLRTHPVTDALTAPPDWRLLCARHPEMLRLLDDEHEERRAGWWATAAVVLCAGLWWGIVEGIRGCVR